MKNLWFLTSEEYDEYQKEKDFTEYEMRSWWETGQDLRFVLKQKDPDDWTLGEVRRAKEFLENPTMSDVDLLCALNDEPITSEETRPYKTEYICANCHHHQETLPHDCPSCQLPWTKITFAHFTEGKYTYFCSEHKQPEIITFEEPL